MSQTVFKRPKRGVPIHVGDFKDKGISRLAEGLDPREYPVRSDFLKAVPVKKFDFDFIREVKEE